MEFSIQALGKVPAHFGQSSGKVWAKFGRSLGKLGQSLGKFQWITFSPLLFLVTILPQQTLVGDNREFEV